MREVKISGVYRHFKGNYYIILGLGKHSETCEDVVIYRALYGNNDIWVRPLDIFLEKVDLEKYPNATQKYKFELCNIKDALNHFKDK